MRVCFLGATMSVRVPCCDTCTATLDDDKRAVLLCAAADAQPLN